MDELKGLGAASRAACRLQQRCRCLGLAEQPPTNAGRHGELQWALPKNKCCDEALAALQLGWVHRFTTDAANAVPKGRPGTKREVRVLLLKNSALQHVPLSDLRPSSHLHPATDLPTGPQFGRARNGSADCPIAAVQGHANSLTTGKAECGRCSLFLCSGSCGPPACAPRKW